MIAEIAGHDGHGDMEFRPHLAGERGDQRAGILAARGGGEYENGDALVLVDQGEQFVGDIAFADVEDRRLAADALDLDREALQHGFGFLALLLAHQVFDRAEGLEVGRRDDIEQRDAAAGALGTQRGVA